MTEYFANFPQIQYGNNVALDITRRVAVLDNISPFSYYPYTVVNEQRPDTIANQYYDDPGKYWLVFHSMGAIDPYYDWPLDDNSFSNFIVAKYGSLTEPQLRVKYYQNQWAGDEQKISVARFDALADHLQKYYTPEFGEGGRILDYMRSHADWTVSTNILINYTLSNVTGSGFQDDERVVVYASGIPIGNSQVCFSNSTQITVQHCFGNTTGGDAIVAQTSNTTANLVFISNVINIPDDEEVFWAPVYYYDYEFGNNEKRKHIRLIDSKYAKQAAKELAKDLA
jgi:hypothetical protein